MGATYRFIDNFVNHAQGFETMRGDAQSVCRFLRLVGGFPQDGGTALGADHRIN